MSGSCRPPSSSLLLLLLSPPCSSPSSCSSPPKVILHGQHRGGKGGPSFQRPAGLSTCRWRDGSASAPSLIERSSAGRARREGTIDYFQLPSTAPPSLLLRFIPPPFDPRRHLVCR